MSKCLKGNWIFVDYPEDLDGPNLQRWSDDYLHKLGWSRIVSKKPNCLCDLLAVEAEGLSSEMEAFLRHNWCCPLGLTS